MMVRRLVHCILKSDYIIMTYYINQISGIIWFSQFYVFITVLLPVFLAFPSVFLHPPVFFFYLYKTGGMSYPLLFFSVMCSPDCSTCTSQRNPQCQQYRHSGGHRCASQRLQCFQILCYIHLASCIECAP